jgi:hypothetical protein
MGSMLLKDHAEQINELFEALEPADSFLTSLKAPMRVDLSFYPVAKNIRFIASGVAEHSRRGRKSKISETPRIGEANFVKDNLGWESWFPWVWSPTANSNADAIRAILGKSHWDPSPVVNRRTLSTSLGREIIDFADHLSALGSVFTLGPEIERAILSKLPSQDFLRCAIGVHVRRGDTQAKGSAWNQPGRDDQFELRDYAEKCIEAGERTGFKNIFVLTDSDDTVEQLASLLPDFDVAQNSFDKSLFFRQALGESVNVEEHVRINPHLAEFYVNSTIGDLWGVSNCAAFVGPLATSEMSRTAFYLQLANSKRLTPHFAVGRELSMMDPNFAALT